MFHIVYSSLLDRNRPGMARSPVSCYRPTVVVSGEEYADTHCIRFIFGTNVPRRIAPNSELSCTYGPGIGRCVLCCGNTPNYVLYLAHRRHCRNARRFCVVAALRRR